MISTYKTGKNNTEKKKESLASHMLFIFINFRWKWIFFFFGECVRCVYVYVQSCTTYLLHNTYNTIKSRKKAHSDENNVYIVLEYCVYENVYIVVKAARIVYLTIFKLTYSRSTQTNTQYPRYVKIFVYEWRKKV